VARRTAQRKDLAKSLAKSLRKGRWPIFSTLSSVKRRFALRVILVRQRTKPIY
jgi:hypothetical protein